MNDDKMSVVNDGGVLSDGAKKMLVESLKVTLAEHDDSLPEEYYAMVKKAVEEAEKSKSLD